MGKKFRLPMDHPEIDDIAARIARVLDGGRLPDAVFGQLVKNQEGLKKADWCLSRRLLNTRTMTFYALPVVSVRPMFYDICFHIGPIRGDYEGDAAAPDAPHYTTTECLAGYVHRIREHLEKVEARFGLGEPVARPVPDDEI